MKKSWLMLAGTICSLLVTSVAHARGGSGILFDVNLFYDSQKTSVKMTGGSESTTGDSSFALYDIKLGKLGDSGFYFGGLYTSRTTSAANASGDSGTAMGASIGYFADAGIFLMGHYLLSATDGKFTDGSGMQVDFGYKAGVGSGWMLGGELTYRSISYKKNTDISSLEKYTKTEVMPMISIGYIF